MKYSGFKKIHDDEEKAIFKHQNGSELKIAKKGLSSQHLEEMKKLPLHAAEGQDILGAEREQAESQPITPNLASASTAAGAVGVPADDATPDQPADPNPAAIGADAGAVTGAQDNSAPPDESAPNAGQPAETPSQIPNIPQDPKQAAMQRYIAEDKNFENDLNNGHITPKTYSDLFHEKSTLGKIGTVFGLLLSGAGSGLAHQPNAALHIMDETIKNDLDAQKTSKNNAENYLRLNQQHQLQQAQIPKMLAEGKLTEQQAKLAAAEADQKAFQVARMQMNRVALHNLVQQMQKLPQGSPQRQQAEQTLGMMYQAINAENFDIADKAAAASSLANFGQDQSVANPEGAFQQRDRMLRMSGNDKLAEDLESKHMPGFKGQSSEPIPQDTRNQLTAQKQYDEKAQEYVDFAKKHSMNWANLNPVQRQAIANQGAAMGANLQSIYRNKIKGGVYKKGEQEFIEQIIPDQPAKWSASFNAIPKVQQTIKDNAADMANTAKSVGLSAAGGAKSSAPSSGGGKEGATGMHNGKPVVFSNGKWRYR